MKENSEEKKKTNSVKLLLFFVVMIIAVFVFARYLINDDFRKEIDTKILKKELQENSLQSIEINSDSNPIVFAYDRYISVFSKNNLTFYNENASQVSKLELNITTPYIVSNSNFLAIAEKDGSKLYMISDTQIKWEKNIEGEISRVSVNDNGYVSVIVKNSTYKSIVVIYDFEGNEMFKTYLATNYALCSEISKDNNYLAIGQIDYSGTIIKSIVKIISIQKANSDSQDSIVHTYESESGKLLTNIKFNKNNEAICMFDSYIQKVTPSTDEKIYDITDNNIFVDVNLDNNIVSVEKETTGLLAHQYKVDIKNTIGKSSNIYMLDNDAPKKVKVTDKIICLSLNNEIRIINSKGWLLKRYTTHSEIQDIVIGNSIMGIVYNNKVEIINL